MPQFVTCSRLSALAVNYGQGAKSLADQIGRALEEAQAFLHWNYAEFSVFRAWRERVINHFALNGVLSTVFGWRLHKNSYLPLEEQDKERTIANFPAQANGAEMMRLSAIWATEAELKVCAPVHDAFLIEAPLSQFDSDVAIMEDIMKKASRVVLGNRLELRVGVEKVRSPDRYSDPRGEVLWKTIMDILADLDTRWRTFAGPRMDSRGNFEN